jgi:hypothetical protein
VWAQSAGPDVTHNRVYRGSTQGGPYTLVATIPAAPGYINSGVSSRAVYFYVVTAVGRNGLESGRSNEAQVGRLRRRR